MPETFSEQEFYDNQLKNRHNNRIFHWEVQKEA